jgi:hypothetical protein
MMTLRSDHQGDSRGENISCTYFQVLHGIYFVILHMVQKLLGGVTYSSRLLTKSHNKYKNRRTPTEWELIAQTDNTIVQ